MYFARLTPGPSEGEAVLPLAPISAGHTGVVGRADIILVAHSEKPYVQCIRSPATDGSRHGLDDDPFAVSIAELTESEGQR